MFRRALEAQWGQTLREFDNPDEAVAKGAAIAAGIERRAYEDSQNDIMILDVSPHRLGVSAIRQVGPGQLIDGYFSEILAKDTKLPATKRQRYGTLFGSQETPISIQIFEATSDSNLCADHRLIAELPLRRLTAGNTGLEPESDLTKFIDTEQDTNEMVQVEFRYTLDGTLDVAVQYIDAPMVRVAGKFSVVSKEGAGKDPAKGAPSPAQDSTAGETASDSPAAAPGSMIAAAMARWRETPHAELCAPLLEQAERLEKENPESSASIRNASDAVKYSLVTGDEREVRQVLDALTDLLFDMT
jgi:molecular chaperone DnaK (HSP70)